jgi:hypothetical protein
MTPEPEPVPAPDDDDLPDEQDDVLLFGDPVAEAGSHPTPYDE